MGRKMGRTTSAKATARSSRAQHPHQPIDMAHLERQALGDKGLEGEVLRLFEQMSHVYFRRLETSTTLDDLLQHLHRLRAAADGVGARRIAELAGLAEGELRAGRPVNPERIDDLGMAVQECAAFIAGLLEHEAA